MKCIAIVVLVVFAAAAQAGRIPLVAAKTTVVQSNPGVQLVAATTPWVYPYYSYPYYGYPYYYPYAAVPVVTGGATSLAATPGSVFQAPLPGHTVSQEQLNLAPAPGTV